MVMTKKVKSVKFVVWLHNFTDARDDEWMTTFAKSAAEARSKCKDKFDKTRFSIEYVQSVKQFRKDNGRGFPLGRKCDRLPG